MTYLHAIGTAQPAYTYRQSELLDFMLKWTNEPTRIERLFLKKMYADCQIQQRHAILPDFDDKYKGKLLFDYGHKLPPIEERMTIFEKEALQLSLKSIRHCLSQIGDFPKSEITHLITVSCTGLSAPGLDIDLTKALGLNDEIQRTGINFMGCYAAFHALKIADDICQNQPEAKVLLVATELCTLHFSPKSSLDQMMANALFADGSAAVLLGGTPIHHQKKLPTLKMIRHRQKLLPESHKEMAWRLGPLNFEMVLSKAIPGIIAKHLPSFLGDFLGKTNIDHYAIHPGGVNILRAVEKSMQLNPKKIAASYEILNQYGNMSSASVLFVLAEILNRHSPTDAPKKVFAGGFGPGLNIEAMLFELAFAD